MTAEFSVAVHALVYLDHVGRLTSSAELADNICTNPARVRKVMAQLHRAGLVEAKEGKGSGYEALPDTGSITLGAVQRALGEEPVSVHWRSGDVDRACQVCSGMAGAMDRVYDRLNTACDAVLDDITVGEVSAGLFRQAPAAKGGAAG
jgi:DNA-binding IscR family transcriptional regulator